MTAGRRVRAPDGVGLSVQVAGSPGGPSVVVGHGVGSSARFVLDAFGPALTSAGWRLVAFDQRGHGDSDPSPSPADFRLDVLAGDLAAVADATGAEVVGGVSLGAGAAVRAADLLPGLRAVVACLPPWTGRATPGRGVHAAVAQAAREHGVAAMVRRHRADPAAPSWLRRVLARDWSRADAASLTAALGALDGGAAPTLTELAGLRPRLAVVGWRDDGAHPWTVAESWAGARPDAVLVAAELTDPCSLGAAAAAALDLAGLGAGGG